MKTYVDVAGQMAPVIGSVLSEQYGVVPLLDIPLMSDEEWQAMCRENFRRKYEKEHGVQAEYPEREYSAYCAEIRQQCADIPKKEVPVIYYS